MKREIAERLDAAFDSHEVRRRLHDVPPHEVYEVSVDGRRAVYKGNTGPTGNAEREGRVMAAVADRTSVPVPEPLCIGDSYYVAAWHPDAPAAEADHEADAAWARAAGRGLATLHEETAPLVDAYGAFRVDEAFAVRGRDEWHAAAVEYVEGRRPVLARYGHADAADRVLDHLAERPDAFAGAGGPVCCHGWATPEHVAVADGAVTCVIDFEHAIAAPGEYDYWRTVLPAFGPGESEPRTAFREGYESVRSLPPGFDRRAPRYALLNTVYYFESLYVQDQNGPAETARKADRLRSRIDAILDDLA
ncbi:aminoglycoside phosphotransferase family protein [Halorubrum sp. SS7]|uniref:phosphotransferase family protein n=1 Tax=Halorubrum sp. SS7 TaxID=2518119 RepID=UPI0010F5FE61|nr:phosphotransferase [Halorubrum sp. SS7]TKX56972.1 aminoglycoside phosphotransferase family protein [Halorubrum sp. SS7]